MKKNKLLPLLTLVLCMSAFFIPTTAYAQSPADTTPPTVSAKLSGETLRVQASDDNSGVDAVFIDGKRVNYRVGGEHMEFTVSEILTVEPGDPVVFAEPAEGVSQLTLYTCTPIRTATHRLLVRAERTA